ncbi:HAD family hydrolase [Nostoc parmelioides]|uniref:Uncharacterized protein n=1 Tax=Nostoc parmelioides FACHB-3921 TaxID=2692909 RepID=A0ABR8BKF2_9NOSO|nr:hypothetical protein [Nostoc parmelioides]MBD2254577.1 hypothetical protein [Nostoc parmelioides FACHB-3921]
MKNNVYSFDVFDTVLVRKWAKPTDLFLELGSILLQAELINISAEKWKNIRESAEREARSRSVSGEVTLIQIYEVLAQNLGWTSTEIEHSINAEVELEFTSLYPVKETQQKIQHLHQDGQRVIYLSDMYLSSEVIRRFLKHHQIWQEGDILYVSSEFNVNKASGKLFEISLIKEGVKASQLVHLGDNNYSDVKMPRKLGIQAQHFNETQLNRYEQILANSQDLPLKFRSLLAGTSRLCRLQNPETNPHNRVIWDTAANVIAPVLFGFVHWCLSQAQSKGIQRLYFVARDGQILLKIAQIICESWNYTIDCRYLYGSRQAWHFPAITEIGETELDWIFDPTQFLSVQSVCERVNLKPEQISEILESNGFSKDIWQKNLNNQQRSLLKQIFKQQEVIQLIIDTAATYREQAIGYFKQEGLADEIPFVIVDIGWNGRLQRSLSKLLNIADMYPAYGLYGFYFGLSRKLKAFPEDCLFAYFSDVDSPSERDNLCHRALLELFVAADHGGTIRFESQNGVFTPILRSKDNNKALEWGLLVQQSSIKHYAQIITKCIKYTDLDINALLKASEKVLKEFVLLPNLKESDVFGSFIFAEDQTENVLYELAPPYKLFDLWNLFLYARHPHHNVWLPASSKRTNYFIKLIIHSKILTITSKIRSLMSRFNKILL